MRLAINRSVESSDTKCYEEVWIRSKAEVVVIMFAKSLFGKSEG